MSKIPPPTGFGLKLRELRKARGWTQVELAERSGLHHYAVVKLERSERGGLFESIIALADALGVRVQVFVPSVRRAMKGKRKKG
jgi:transcriptional regulator with XRE-family HTH domain